MKRPYLTAGVHLAYCIVPVKQGKGKKERVGSGVTDWSAVADWYDQLVGEAGSEYHRQVVLPGVMRLLTPAPGQRILDVACGQGVLARLLFARGANVTGVDASAELIAAARKRNESLKCDDGVQLPEYHVGDARKLEFLPMANFAAAACVLAIQNIQPIQPVFAGVARTLETNGRFVVAMMHPCFRGAKETSWGWDEARKVQYRRVDRYLLPRKSPIVAHPGARASKYTWTFHRPIEMYVKALRNAGLLVDAMEEWPSHKISTSGPRLAAENQARKEIPMFCAIRAIKISLPTTGDAQDP